MPDGQETTPYDWLDDVQAATAEWREETLNGETTSRTQASHTAVEAGEVMDLVVKMMTYSEDRDLELDAARTELGDVVVAHLGTVEKLDMQASRLLEDEPAPEPGVDMLDTVIKLQYNAVKLAACADRGSDVTDSRALYAASVLHLCYKIAPELESTVKECVDAALAKNGARNWEGWQA